MMSISYRFNRYYHAFLEEVYENAYILIFKDFIEETEAGPRYFVFRKGIDFFSKNELKYYLKLLNLSYPVDEKGIEKLSTRKISPKSLVDHIEYVHKVCIDSKVFLPSVEEEWQRIIMASRSEIEKRERRKR